MKPSDRSPRRHGARRLRDVLRSEVLRGAFEDGRLPSEADLMTHYRSPRQTVRDALALLRAEGLVDRLQGTGTFVVVHRDAWPLLEAHGIRGDWSRVVVRQLRREVVPLPPPIAHQLDDEAGSPCLLVEYLGIDDGAPWALVTNYVRYPEAERLSDLPLHWHWYDFLARVGLQIGRTSFLIEALLADEPVADLLGCRIGAPLLAMEQVIRDEAERPYNVAFVRVRGDRFALLSEAARQVGVQQTLR